jgi:putative oxidoreductase
MERWLGRFMQYAFVLLRVISGLMFFGHGAQKVLGIFGGTAMAPWSLAWVAGLIELVTGAAIALGLFGGWAAFLASGEMAVAYFKAHAARGFLPIGNGGELAVVYCFLFLFIAAHGSGPLSLDAWLFGRRGGRPGN